MSLLEMKRNLNFIYEHSHANLTDVTIICLISSLTSAFILLVLSGPQLIKTWNGHSFVPTAIYRGLMTPILCFLRWLIRYWHLWWTLWFIFFFFFLPWIYDHCYFATRNIILLSCMTASILGKRKGSGCKKISLLYN